MTTVYGYVVLPDGKGVAGAQVFAEISGSGPPYYYGDGYIIGYDKTYATTSSSGRFSMTLYPNGLLSPSDSVYTFMIKKGDNDNSVFYMDSDNVQTTEFTNVIVPASDEPVALTDLL